MAFDMRDQIILGTKLCHPDMPLNYERQIIIQREMVTTTRDYWLSDETIKFYNSRICMYVV